MASWEEQEVHLEEVHLEEVHLGPPHPLALIVAEPVVEAARRSTVPSLPPGHSVASLEPTESPPPRVPGCTRARSDTQALSLSPSHHGIRFRRASSMVLGVQGRLVTLLPVVEAGPDVAH